MRPVTHDRPGPLWQPTFGVWIDGAAAVVRVWAPDARTVDIETRDRVSFSTDVPPDNDPRFLVPDETRSLIPLARDESGFFGARLPELAAGDRYRFVLDGELAIPDPASRFQPDGVHGLSEVIDPSRFAWAHPALASPRLDALVIYELHIGTFTREGTFAAAAQKLAWLVDIGITAVELMPVAAFPGTRNWGYDGAALFAPASVYGRPDDLRRFVDEAHRLGLAVLLDVVYNHFGPAGAYAVAASSRFLSDRHASPWGRGVNLDGPESRHVRQFFIDNALHWLVDYRFDGLRLDATHALVDESRVHFLAELTDVVRQTVGDRHGLLVAEDHRNLRALLDTRPQGGWGLDAVWADDFHHVVRRLVAGDDEGYFRDYRGDASELVRTLRNGWLYQGEPSVHHGARRGTDPVGLDLTRFIICLQNHDQIGNRALGDRLHHTADLATWRALSVLLLVAPETPLLFMGQEWAASSPFQYFTDHEPELGRLVSEGRRNEFRTFRAFSDPKRRSAIPDPQALDTFMRSKLVWEEIDRPPQAGVLALYRRLLRLRRALAPEGAAATIGPDRVAAVNDESVWMRRRTRDGHELLIIVRMRGQGPVTVPLEGDAAWTLVLDTEDSPFAEDGRPLAISIPEGTVDFARPGAVVLERQSVGRSDPMGSGGSNGVGGSEDPPLRSTGEDARRGGSLDPPEALHSPPLLNDLDALAEPLRNVLHVPTSTYRVQLSAQFTFADLAAIAPYLDALGVGACYLSPCLRARPHSSHGYDVVDYRELNPELGTRAEFEALAQDLRSRGMGLLLDVVPNHMAVDPVYNPYWHDVLQNGPSAASAEWFDIDWQPVKDSLRNRVLLPILGDQYGVVLERGELRLGLRQDGLVLHYFDQTLPINPEVVPVAFRPEVDELRSRADIDERDMRELLSVMTAFANLPPHVERDPSMREERQRESQVACERFVALLDRSPVIRDAMQSGLARLNGRPGVPESFDALHAILEQQPYHVAYWRTAFDEINYRRFFDINDLAAVRMEDPQVFTEAHRLVLEFVRAGLVTGLRLDHPDGLYDPEEYFERLQAAAWRHAAEVLLGSDQQDRVDALVEWRAARRDEDRAHWAVRPLYLVAEKILSGGEQFRTRWAIHGGTGYVFLNIVNGLFIDGAGLHQLRRLWARLSGQQEPFPEIANESRRLIAQTAMASEMNMLAHGLERIASRDRRSRDFTLNSLRRVLREVVAGFPVYRTYVTVRGVSETDRAVIARAVAEARRRSPVMEASIFEFIERVLTGIGPSGAPDDECLRFAMKFQQTTSPIQAKGVEDTAFYRDVPLLATNEVGSDPASPTISIEQFHAANSTRLQQWPGNMLALATHDTKRGADARARLTVLSERAGEWRRAVAQWMRVNARHRPIVGGVYAPDRGDEYHFYQALLAIWPPEIEGSTIPVVAPPGLDTRVADYMVKAIREAKIRSSWLRPDQAYEDGVTAFIRTVLTASAAGRFRRSFVPFARTIARAGAVTSLAEHVLMAGVPGVPDIYQGAELWHLCLVDPDNRQPVDFSWRRSLLASLDADLDRASASSEPGMTVLPIVNDLVARWTDGQIKLWIVAATLRHRRRDPDLFLRGEYVPLAARPAETAVVAFARIWQSRALVVIAAHHAGRLAGRGWPTGAAWGDAAISLPPKLAGRAWRDLLTGRSITLDMTSHLELASVLDPLPVAWLAS
jgi:(1->4)-alpha-D-glucan 1-alpha-D-glucosylmutase